MRSADNVYNNSTSCACTRVTGLLSPPVSDRGIAKKNCDTYKFFYTRFDVILLIILKYSQILILINKMTFSWIIAT